MFALSAVVTAAFLPARLISDGRIPERHPLQECDSRDYSVRTGLNVRDSDATLILTRGPLRGGTALTAGLCRKEGKPCLIIDLEKLSREDALSQVWGFLQRERPWALNIAGPRESGAPGIYRETRSLLRKLFN